MSDEMQKIKFHIEDDVAFITLADLSERARGQDEQMYYI